MQEPNKPYLKVDEQIERLQARGLIIDDEEKAAHYLTQIGYYRLSGYSYAFRKSTERPDGSIKVLDNFKEGSRFSDVHALYVFDKRLRMLLLDAIERIEVSLRVAIALELGKHDIIAHLKRKYFNDYAEEKLQKWQNKYSTKVDDSREEFVKHHKSKEVHLPIWVGTELWDFGMLSNFISLLKDEYKKPIASKYKIPRIELLVSWLHTLNEARNISAHHARLWNKIVVSKPKLPKHQTIELLDPLIVSKTPNNKIFPVICIIMYLMKIVSPNSSWKKRFMELIEAFPKSQHINIGMIGIPAGWQNWDLWK